MQIQCRSTRGLLYPSVLDRPENCRADWPSEAATRPRLNRRNLLHSCARSGPIRSNRLFSSRIPGPSAQHPVARSHTRSRQRTRSHERRGASPGNLHRRASTRPMATPRARPGQPAIQRSAPRSRRRILPRRNQVNQHSRQATVIHHPARRCREDLRHCRPVQLHQLWRNPADDADRNGNDLQRNRMAPRQRPQPGVQDNSRKGSFIPSFGDALYRRYHVTIGIPSVGHGSTSGLSWAEKVSQYVDTSLC